MESEHTPQPLVFEIKGLDCPDCAAKLEKAVRALPGVVQAELVYSAARMTVTPSDGMVVLPAIVGIGESMGFTLALQGTAAEPKETGWRAWLRDHRRDVASILGGLFLAIAFGLHLAHAPELAVQLLYGAAIVVGGFYIAREGWATLRTAHSLDINTLMVIAAVGAMVVNQFAEGAVTVFLFSIGELLEGYSADRARHAIRALMELAPAEATLLQEGREALVPVASLHLGDRVLVHPGERVPMDGRIIEGRSAINQAPVTGESIPVEKQVGDEAFAGTINGTGALVIEVTHLAADNTIARIMRMVEEAQSQRAPAQRFVDRFARVYTPIVVAVAFLVAVVPPLVGLGAFNVWLYRALVLLVIGCPCALVISTPVTIVSALARAARLGVLIKGGRYLEDMAAVRVIAFDKTGTLTQGKPYVVDGACALHPGEARSCSICEDLLAKAAAVEGSSEHALAQAVTQHAALVGVGNRYARSESVTAVTGMGVEGLVEGHNVTVGSQAFCKLNGSLSEPLCRAASEAEAKGYTVLMIQDACCDSSCYLAVSDTLREAAPAAIQRLKDAGIEHTVMLTGDNAFIAQAIAQKAGIDEVRAGLLPEGKVQAVEELQTRYHQVAMVGDGVNDAPAMAKASLGIAMGAAGTDTAIETADIALMSDDLSRLPVALRLSRQAMRIVRANIIFALALKALFLALAVAGVATLWMAVLADTGASILVTMNGMRMLAFHDEKAA